MSRHAWNTSADADERRERYRLAIERHKELLRNHANVQARLIAADQEIGVAVLDQHRPTWGEDVYAEPYCSTEGPHVLWPCHTWKTGKRQLELREEYWS